MEMEVDHNETMEVVEVEEPVKRPRGRPKKGSKKAGAVVAAKAAVRGRKASIIKTTTLVEEAVVVDESGVLLEEDNHSSIIKQESLQESVDEIEANVKGISISQSMSNPSEEAIIVSSVEETAVEEQPDPSERVEAVFIVKEEKPYNPNCIPGFDIDINDDIDPEVDSSTSTVIEKVKAEATLIENASGVDKEKQSPEGKFLE
jgi:hypothetical protein